MTDQISELTESKTFWCTKLIDAIAPSVIHKFRQIFEEALSISNETKETRLYLKAFQNALNFIPEWSNTCIQKECQDIITRSKCHHLKDLITTVHVIALKMVTNMRTNSKAKSVHINIPDIEVFIHSIYINAARQIWKAAFLYSREVDLVQQQKNQYEIEKIIRGVVYHTIQDNIPAESFIHSYLAEDVEEDEEIIIEPIIDLPPSSPPSLETLSANTVSFSEPTPPSSTYTAPSALSPSSTHTAPSALSPSSVASSSYTAPPSFAANNVNLDMDYDLDLGLQSDTGIDLELGLGAAPKQPLFKDAPEPSPDGVDDLFDLNIEHV